MRLTKASLLLCLAGAASADPILDRITVTKSVPMENSTFLDFASATATCPDETVLLTGGATALADNGGVPPAIAVVSSVPEGNGWTAWIREMSDQSGGGVNLIVTAVCGIVRNSFSPHLRIVQTSAALNRSASTLDVVQAFAECPSTHTLVSGGARLQGPGGSVPVQVALMRNRSAGNGWQGVAREIVDNPFNDATLTVYAVCADAGSGISSPTVASATTVLPDGSGLDAGTASASCPSGKTRLGGGADILSSNGGIPIGAALMASEANSGNGWNATGREMIHSTRAPTTLNVTSLAQCYALSGVSGVVTVTRNYTLPNTSALLDAVSGGVQCPSGKSMVGGGARILSSNGGLPPTIALVSSAPEGNGWTAVARETLDASRSIAVNLTVSAVCAVLPP